MPRTSLLSREPLEDSDSPLEYMLRTDEELAVMDPSQFVRPAIDNNLRNPKEMHLLVRRLFDPQPVTFRRKA